MKVALHIEAEEATQVHPLYLEGPVTLLHQIRGDMHLRMRLNMTIQSAIPTHSQAILRYATALKVSSIYPLGFRGLAYYIVCRMFYSAILLFNGNYNF